MNWRIKAVYVLLVGALFFAIFGDRCWCELQNLRFRERKVVSTEYGMASWYGDKFHGEMTANGEAYNMRRLTAAHKKLPFNTYVRVVALESDRSVIVRINDRGPFVEGRIIDLSRKAAKRLGMYEKGVTKIRLEILGG